MSASSEVTPRPTIDTEAEEMFRKFDMYEYISVAKQVTSMPTLESPSAFQIDSKKEIKSPK